jgi:hypothetical protein
VPLLQVKTILKMSTIYYIKTDITVNDLIKSKSLKITHVRDTLWLEDKNNNACELHFHEDNRVSGIRCWASSSPYMILYALIKEFNVQFIDQHEMLNLIHEADLNPEDVEQINLEVEAFYVSYTKGFIDWMDSENLKNKHDENDKSDDLPF